MVTLLNLFIEKLLELFLILISLFSLFFNTFIPQARDFIIETFRDKGDIVESIREIDYTGIFDNNNLGNILDSVNTPRPGTPEVPRGGTSVPTSEDSNVDSSREIETGNNVNTGTNLNEVIQSPPINQTYNLAGTMRNIAEVSVNIICLETVGALTTASTGSGVIVSPNGVILTNAHVAQLLLLESSGFNIECSIYQTNTSNYGYKAEIMYLSPEWIYENAAAIAEPKPKGTGENDYALLLITNTTNSRNSLPTSFPYAKINLVKDLYRVNLPIKISGFPGGPANIYDLRKAGNLRIDDSTITDVYSFNYRDVELFTTERTFVAERGASGGGIYSNDSLIGITVTISPEGVGHKINAITTNHIDSSIKNSSGKSLIEILSNDPYVILNQFKNSYLINLSNIIKNQL